jgi:hypothetical protein
MATLLQSLSLNGSASNAIDAQETTSSKLVDSDPHASPHRNCAL